MNATARFGRHLSVLFRGVAKDPSGWFQAGKEVGWFSKDIIDRSWTFGRWKVHVRWRRGDGIMGRFGGGWQWELGVQVGGSTVLFNLVFLSVSICRLPKPKEVVNAPQA